jgi:hypothetical protein
VLIERSSRDRSLPLNPVRGPADKHRPLKEQTDNEPEAYEIAVRERKT